MPATETICIDFGNWIAVFPVVYAMAAFAVVAASAVLIDWSINRGRANLVAGGGKANCRAEAVEARA